VIKQVEGSLDDTCQDMDEKKKGREKKKGLNEKEKHEHQELIYRRVNLFYAL
jgi:hypothetical protein